MWSRLIAGELRETLGNYEKNVLELESRTKIGASLQSQREQSLKNMKEKIVTLRAKQKEHKLKHQQLFNFIMNFELENGALIESITGLQLAFGGAFKSKNDLLHLGGKTLSFPVLGTKVREERSINSRESSQVGIFFGSNKGSRVVAIERGTVLIVRRLNTSWKNLVIISHGSGYASVYAMLENVSKKVGDFVEAGEVIGQPGHSLSDTFESNVKNEDGSTEQAKNLPDAGALDKIFYISVYLNGKAVNLIDRMPSLRG